MADGPTKWRYLSGYVLELLEIIVIVITMFINPLGKTFQYRDEFLALMIGSFMLGLSCMVMYYEYFHPSRARIETENESEIFKNASIGSDKDSGEEENSSVKYAKDDDEEFGDNVNV
uniref:XK-related protein n=1 Tax=Rhabditophanes sp. KR3021 TaxID=114890 RepID=A0AC35U741_9BILA